MFQDDRMIDTLFQPPVFTFQIFFYANENPVFADKLNVEKSKKKKLSPKC